ncbi:hypothetical protein HPB47_014262, partial [Ixodes persulcatus]
VFPSKRHGTWSTGITRRIHILVARLNASDSARLIPDKMALIQSFSSTIQAF